MEYFARRYEGQLKKLEGYVERKRRQTLEKSVKKE